MALGLMFFQLPALSECVDLCRVRYMCQQLQLIAEHWDEWLLQQLEQ